MGGRHKNTIEKRNLKSVYYDRATSVICQATLCPSYPAVRKTRYIFLGQWANVPVLTNKKVLNILRANKINTNKLIRKVNERNKDLPF